VLAKECHTENLTPKPHTSHPMAKKASKKKAQPDFETSLQHLKEALAALESEELTLEQSLAQYEAGIKYLGHCHGALEVARQKIEQLVN